MKYRCPMTFVFHSLCGLILIILMNTNKTNLIDKYMSLPM